jgi:divalent metal cation (Fe/Co/Zn/Cd) transporter
MGIKMIIETSDPLIGTTPDKEFVDIILNDILSYEGVLGTHDVIAHCYGPTKIFLSVHVEVDANVNVLVSHDLIDNIENDMKKKHNVFLVIHMDPIITDSEEVNKLKEFANGILKKKHESLTLHDFRVVFGQTHTNILFDVVLPYNLKIEEDDLQNYISVEFKNLNEGYNVIVKVDREYTD